MPRLSEFGGRRGKDNEGENSCDFITCTRYTFLRILINPLLILMRHKILDEIFLPFLLKI